jgi:hypothetical protein
MEEMKSRLYLILSLLFFFCLSSCASTPAGEAKDIHNEKKQNQKKLLFEDWKYKGFGQPLPVWFEAAYKGDVEEVGRKISLSDNHKIEIVTAQGINSDQANKSLWQKLVEKAELFELYDSSWALLGEKGAIEKNNSYPYYAAAVIIIDIKQE